MSGSTTNLAKPRIFINRNTKLFLLALGLVGLIWIIATRFGTGFDWEHFFRPATLALLSGISPYSIEGFYSPPWLLFFFIPIVWLPFNISAAILFLCNLLAFGYVAYRMGAKPLTMIALVFTPHVFHGSFEANIDWIAILGLLFPPQIGLFFVLLKPQIGVVIAMFWLVESWRMGGIQEVIKVFAPVTGAFILSFIIFGLWPLHFLELPNSPWNTSMFPYSLAVALVLFGLAIQKRDQSFAITASPFISPYLAAYTWPVAVLGLVRSQPLALLAIAGLWLSQVFSGFPIFRYWFAGK